MNARIHKTEWQRIELWLIWTAVLAALLLIIAPRVAGIENTALGNVTEQRTPASGAVPLTGGVPFTAWDVVQYFSTVLEMSAEAEPNGTLVFENHQATFPEDRWRIAISIERKAVVVEFVVSGDYGMNLAREFFECPLFERAESEQFYKMLHFAGKSPVKHLRRFTVSMTAEDTTEGQSLVLRFTPPKAV